MNPPAKRTRYKYSIHPSFRIITCYQMRPGSQLCPIPSRHTTLDCIARFLNLGIPTNNYPHDLIRILKAYTYCTHVRHSACSCFAFPQSSQPHTGFICARELTHLELQGISIVSHYCYIHIISSKFRARFNSAKDGPMVAEERPHPCINYNQSAFS